MGGTGDYWVKSYLKTEYEIEDQMRAMYKRLAEEWDGHNNRYGPELHDPLAKRKFLNGIMGQNLTGDEYLKVGRFMDFLVANPGKNDKTDFLFTDMARKGFML